MQRCRDDVTAARIIVPRATYALTRRCAFRKMLWAPQHPVIQQGMLYALARAQEETGVAIHGGCGMPNHGHWCISSDEPNVPAFTEYFFRESSKFLMNALNELGYSAPESIWDDGRPHMMRLMDVEAELVWHLYTLQQPVDAAIVRRAKDYPGWWTDPSALLGRTSAIAKPPIYFGRKQPSQAQLELSCSPLIERSFGDVGEAVHWLERELRRGERACAARGRGVLGAEACKRIHPWSEPKTPRTGFLERIPSFMVATRGPEGDTLRRRCGEETGQWRGEYEGSWRGWKRGDRTVEFPFGCYAMRVRHGARVKAPPAEGTRLVNAPGPGIVRPSVLERGRLDDAERNELRGQLRDAARRVTPADDTLAARLTDNAPNTVDRAAQPHPQRDEPDAHPKTRTVLRGRGRPRGRHLPAQPENDAADPNPLADVAAPESTSTHPLLRLEAEPDAAVEVAPAEPELAPEPDPDPPPT